MRPLSQLKGESAAETAVALAVNVSSKVHVHLGPPPRQSQADLAEDGFSTLCWTAGAFCLGWVILFYAVAWMYPWFKKRMEPSTKSYEDDPYYFSRNVIGIFHATLVGVPCVFAAASLMGAPDYVKYGSSRHIGTCTAEANTNLVPWGYLGETVALCGVAFTTFTVVDVFIGTIHQMLTADLVAHHLAFITAGIIIRVNCLLPWNASILMAMEISTPFLNYMLLFRHRGDAYKCSVITTGIIFFVTYCIFRIGLNTYGSVELWMVAMDGRAAPSRVESWVVWTLVGAITAGAVVQLFWLPLILSSLGARIKTLVTPPDYAFRIDDSLDSRRLPSAGCVLSITDSNRSATKGIQYLLHPQASPSIDEADKPS